MLANTIQVPPGFCCGPDTASVTTVPEHLATGKLLALPVASGRWESTSVSCFQKETKAQKNKV